MINSPTLSNNNKKVSNWIPTIISSEKIKAFDSSLIPIISNLGKGRIILILTNLFFFQKTFFFIV